MTASIVSGGGTMETHAKLGRGARRLGVLVPAVIGLMVLAGPSVPKAHAAAITQGLGALTVQGVGTGTTSTGVTTCGNETCPEADTDFCTCIVGGESVRGNRGFNNGTLTFHLLFDTIGTTLEEVNLGEGVGLSPLQCFPGQGDGILSNANGKNKLLLILSGEACPTTSEGLDVFNGTYFITSGSGAFPSTTTGSGAINGSQVGAAGASFAAINGTVQK
jgi:hypothetical protein